MPFINVKEALSGETRIGTHVTVRGWVRTRRDSKATIDYALDHHDLRDNILAHMSGILVQYSVEKESGKP